MGASSSQNSRDSQKSRLTGCGSIENPALGFLELTSISRGLYLTDTIIKKAPVRVICSQPISSGKHVILFFGDVASVEASYREAVSLEDGALVRKVFIPSIHPMLVGFLESLWNNSPQTDAVAQRDSTCIVESSTLAGAVLSADAALKGARVKLNRLRLGQGIGGKAYFVLSGEHPEIEAAQEIARTQLLSVESLVRTDLVARPDAEAMVHF